MNAHDEIMALSSDLEWDELRDKAAQIAGRHDKAFEELKVRLHSYDKALEDIQAARRFSIDGSDHVIPVYSHQECVEIASLALSMNPEDFIGFMQEPPQ